MAAHISFGHMIAYFGETFGQMTNLTLNMTSGAFEKWVVRATRFGKKKNKRREMSEMGQTLKPSAFNW
jgi:hypothetical protein